MFKSILVFIMLVFGNNLQAQIRSNKDLIGKWESSQMRAEFYADGRVGLLLRGGTMPGATYKTDFFNDPATLEITVTQDRSKKVFKAYIRFINSSTIEMQEFDPDYSATAFIKEKVLLKKVR